jgi:deoxyribonuclease V
MKRMRIGSTERMRWPSTLAEAREIQHALKEKIRIVPLSETPEFIAAVDAAFIEKKVFGSACLFNFPSLALAEQAFAEGETAFPYIPGYLSFREGPVIVEALKRLGKRPDLILIDGHGIAHPFGIGLASFIGVVLDLPAIGCAKSRLVGDFIEPGKRKGDRSPLTYQEKIIGMVLRTREGVKPVFVSPGHKIDLEDSCRIILQCAVRYRLPEPLRRADAFSRELKQTFLCRSRPFSFSDGFCA